MTKHGILGFYSLRQTQGVSNLHLHMTYARPTLSTTKLGRKGDELGIHGCWVTSLDASYVG